MKEIITLKNILIIPIIISSILIYNCTSDQNLIGYKDSPSQSLSKINETEISDEVLNLEAEEMETIEIQVAPKVLNLQNNGVVVTIHTDIPFSNVIVSTVSLNGIVIQSWKADSRGFFVAKFNLNEVKSLTDLVIEDYNTLTLVGESTNGGFSGTENILVVSNTGK